MRYFVLLDLLTQADYLPPEMQDWPQERFLSWLALFGEVSPPWPIRGTARLGFVDHDIDIWLFRAPTGRETTFIISRNHQLVIFVSMDHQILDLNVRQIWGPKVKTIFALDT